MRIYLDYAATCPIHPQVLDAYVEELRRVGNPSALHASGQSARMRIEAAREQLAQAVGAETAEVVFTSGGTESDNLAVKGLFWQANKAHFDAVQKRMQENASVVQEGGEPSVENAEAVAPPLDRPVVMVSAIEHPAVLETAEWLETQGATLITLPVDEQGVVRVDTVRELLEKYGDRTAVVSVMWANNEIGALQPVTQITELAHDHGAFMHTDAVQALGGVELNFGQAGVDAMTITAHKIGGPVGVGALILKRGVNAVPVLHGGGQERSVRSGTLDVPGAVAFAQAAKLATENRDDKVRIAHLRDRLIAGIEERIPDAQLTGPRGDGRLPGNVHFVFPGCEGDTLLFGLDMAGFDTATGSACSAGVNRPSHVLLALGRSEDNARSSQRFTLGPGTTDEHIDALLDVLPGVVENARKAGMVSATPAWMSAGKQEGTETS